MTRQRKRQRARGFGAPLWWLRPPPAVVDEIVREARIAVGHGSGESWRSMSEHQSFLRRAMAETDRRLAARHIYVDVGEFCDP